MADQPQKQARSRGRAKGRARPPAAAQARPGEEPVPAAAAAAAAVAHPPMGSGGRQAHRGVPRVDPVRPGEQVADITQRMGALGVHSEMAAGGAVAQIGRAAGRARYEIEELVTRPPESALQSKSVSGYPPVPLLTNYFALQSRTSWSVHQYHVDFSPVVESSFMRRVLLNDHKERLGSCYLFDGMSDLKAVVKLEEPITELFSQRRSDGANIRIQIKHVNELAPNNPQLGHLFNTQMRRNLRHLKYKLIGRNYFDTHAIVEKDQLKLQIWPGIITSIRMQEKDVMMMVDTVHKIVRKDTALDLLSDTVRRYPSNFKDVAVKELVGAIVMTAYNTRTYRIEEICWSEKPRDTFESKEGPISYLQYYKKHYDITIRDANQPLLLCTSKEREIRGGQSQSKRIMLVPELCSMTGLTERMRSDFTLMKELANETKLDPEHRVANLRTFTRKLHENPNVNKEMDAWDIKFSTELVALEGHSLDREQIIQQKMLSGYDTKSGDFSKEMRGKAMHVPRDLHTWLVICTRQDQGRCQDFLQTLQRVCTPMGMRLNHPELYFIDDDRIGTYTRTFQENVRKETQIVVFIVPNNKKDRYDALKKLTCLDCPVPSQVIVSRTLSKKQMLMSVSTKIGIQLNCKLGGEPWALDIPIKTPTMIIGYDTYHDSSRKGRSAGGFVASMNQTFTRWYSKVNFHQAGGWQELSNHLSYNLTAALRKFHDVNGCAPKIIIFFRDGVGDGQIRYVLDWEVAQMQRTLNEVLDTSSQDPKGSNGVRFAFFIVNKKISTRFFAPVGNRIVNPPPGTVVDHTVTRYERYDFFLVSQSVRQGTVAPTMYNIIKDTSGLQPKHMQRLAFKLTHLYYNWPGTIRVPAPCQYAHKLAFLSGQSLHREPSEHLSDTLFYL